MAICARHESAALSYLEAVPVATVDVPTCLAQCGAGYSCELIGQPVAPNLDAAAAVEAWSEGFLVAVVPLLAAFGAAVVVQAVKRF